MRHCSKPKKKLKEEEEGGLVLLLYNYTHLKVHVFTLSCTFSCINKYYL